MPYSLRNVRQAFTGKFGFDVDQGQRHPTFVFRHGGEIVAKTHVSHGAGRATVSDGVVSAMARQIGVSGPQLRDGIECRLSGPSIVALILQAAARER